jgi:hypothetical protein
MAILHKKLSELEDVEGNPVAEEIVRYAFIVEWQDQPVQGLRLTVADIRRQCQQKWHWTPGYFTLTKHEYKEKRLGKACYS